MNFIVIALYTLADPFEEPESLVEVEISKYENGIKTFSVERPVKPENLEQYFEEYCYEDEDDEMNDEIPLEVAKGPTFEELWNSELKNLFNGELPITFFGLSNTSSDLDISILRTLFQNRSINHQPIKYFDFWEITQKTWKDFRDIDFYLAKYYFNDIPKKWFSDSTDEKRRAVFCVDKYNGNYLTDTEATGEIVLLAAKEKGCRSIDELLATCGVEMKVY